MLPLVVLLVASAAAPSTVRAVDPARAPADAVGARVEPAAGAPSDPAAGGRTDPDEARSEAARMSLGPDGLEVSSADGRFSLSLDGRLHVDWTRHSGPAAQSPIDGAEIRRARIAVAGQLDGSWRFSAETDFAGNDIALKDFWVAYEASDTLRLTIGHQKQPYNLTFEMSSNDIPFVERGIDNALLAPFVDRATGVRADASGRSWFAAAGVFGASIDEADGWGTAGRFVLAPFADEKRVLHVGIRAAYREPDSANAIVRIRDETTSFSEVSVVDTASIDGVDSVTLAGPEAAFASGPFSVVGEYNRAHIEDELGSLSFDSWHLTATWSLTGESRAAAYDLAAGEFKRLEPAQRFARREGGGAWEIAARYASIDLNDEFVGGGAESAMSLSANWYPNRNVRMMLNWTRILETDESTDARAAAEGLDVVAVRAQYAF
jgi:phosphate-selective porin OprO and OprP